MNPARMGWMVVAMVVGMGVPKSAHASFYVSSLGSESVPSAGLASFTYTLSFNPNDFGINGSSQLTSGNYVTLYDFSPNLIPSSTVVASPGLTYSIQPTGFTASNFPGTVPPDSALIDNVTFTYTGPTVLTATSFSVTITLPGVYTIGSQFGNYGGIATYQTTNVVSTTGQYFIPLSTVPEPSSLALCGIAGAVGVGMARMRRRRASV